MTTPAQAPATTAAPGLAPPMDGTAQLGQISYQLGQLTTQVAVLIEQMRTVAVVTVPDHENRLRQHAEQLHQIDAKLGRTISGAIGWAIGTGLLSGGVVSSVVSLVVHK